MKKTLLWFRDFLGLLLFMSPTIFGAVGVGVLTMFLLSYVPIGSLPWDTTWTGDNNYPNFRGFLTGIGVGIGYAMTGFLYGNFLAYANRKTEERKPPYMGRSPREDCPFHNQPFIDCANRHKKPIVYQFEEPGIEVQEKEHEPRVPRLP